MTATPASLRSLCETIVTEIRLRETKYYDWREVYDRTSMLPEETRRRKRETEKDSGSDVRATMKKWSSRLNSYRERWHCRVCRVNQKTSFDEHGTLFNLAFRSIVRNLYGAPQSGELFCVDRPFYRFICETEIPRVIRNELLEWHGLAIMADRFVRYRSECLRRYQFPQDPPSPLAEVLAIWDRRCKRYHGLIYAVSSVKSVVNLG